MAYIAGGGGSNVAVQIKKVKLLNNQEPQDFGSISSSRGSLLNLVAVPVDIKDRENNYFLFFAFTGGTVQSVSYAIRANKVRTLDDGSESLLLVDNIDSPTLFFHHTINSQKVGGASIVDVFYAYQNPTP